MLLQFEHWFLLLDEAIAWAVFVIISGLDGRTEKLLEPAKQLENDNR